MAGECKQGTLTVQCVEKIFLAAMSMIPLAESYLTEPSDLFRDCTPMS